MSTYDQLSPELKEKLESGFAKLQNTQLSPIEVAYLDAVISENGNASRIWMALLAEYRNDHLEKKRRLSQLNDLDQSSFIHMEKDKHLTWKTVDYFFYPKLKSYLAKRYPGINQSLIRKHEVILSVELDEEPFEISNVFHQYSKVFKSPNSIVLHPHIDYKCVLQKGSKGWSFEIITYDLSHGTILG